MIDLENFPTSESAKRMMDRITKGFYDDSYVGKWIFQVMGIEIDEARKLIEEELPYQAFVRTVTWGIRYFEEKYGIPVDETLDLETRRKRIIDKLNSRGSMNPERMRIIAENATGRKCDVQDFVDDYTFWITIYQGETGFDFYDFLEKINRNKPSHLSYGIDLNFHEESKLAVAIAVKEYCKLVPSGYENTGDSDLNGITWYVDENEDTLIDEQGNILIE